MLLSGPKKNKLPDQKNPMTTHCPPLARLRSFARSSMQRLRGNLSRLGMVIALAFVAGVLFYANYRFEVLGMPLPVYTGLLYAVVIGFVGAVVYACLPGLQLMMETVAISRLGIAVWAFNNPEQGAQLLASPLVSATLVIAGAIVIRGVVHGGWAGKTGQTLVRPFLRQPLGGPSA